MTDGGALLTRFRVHGGFCGLGDDGGSF